MQETNTEVDPYRIERMLTDKLHKPGQLVGEPIPVTFPFRHAITYVPINRAAYYTMYTTSSEVPVPTIAAASSFSYVSDTSTHPLVAISLNNETVNTVVGNGKLFYGLQLHQVVRFRTNRVPLQLFLCLVRGIA